MHLSGSSDGPHLHHVHVSHTGDLVTLDWEVRNAPVTTWRVLRSFEGFASCAEAANSDGHRQVVGEGSAAHLTDAGGAGRPAFYTIFSLEPDGSWQRQVEAAVRPHHLLRWFHPDAEAIHAVEGDLESNPSQTVELARGRFAMPLSNPSERYLSLSGK